MMKKFGLVLLFATFFVSFSGLVGCSNNKVSSVSIPALSSQAQIQPQSSVSINTEHLEAEEKTPSFDSLEVYLSQKDMVISKINLLSDNQLLLSLLDGSNQYEAVVYNLLSGLVQQVGNDLTYDQFKSASLGQIPYQLDRQERMLNILSKEGKVKRQISLPILEQTHVNEWEQFVFHNIAVSPSGHTVAYPEDKINCGIAVIDTDTCTKTVVTPDMEKLLSSSEWKELMPDELEWGKWNFRSLYSFNDRCLVWESWAADSMPIKKLYLFIDAKTGDVLHVAMEDYTFVYCNENRSFLLTNLSMDGVLQTEGNAVWTADFNTGALVVEQQSFDSKFLTCSNNGRYLLSLQGKETDPGFLSFAIINSDSLEKVWEFRVEKTETIQDYYDLLATVSDDGKLAIVTSRQSRGENIYYFVK